MNELELMKHAKSYIDQMARGIDPLSGQKVPEDDLINQVRIARCLFYVSGVLDKVIQNGGVVKGSKTKKSPFALTEEQRQRVPYSEAPIAITPFKERLDQMIDRDSMKGFPRKRATDWLVETGLLEEITLESGSKVKRPTAQGDEMGIMTERRMSQTTGQEYTVVLYSEDAQHFLIDNLDAILQE